MSDSDSGVELNGLRMNGAGNGNSMFRRQDSPYPRSVPISRPMPSPYVVTQNNPPRSTNFTYEFHGPSNPTFFIFQNPGSYAVNYNGGGGSLPQRGGGQTVRFSEVVAQDQGIAHPVGISPIPREGKEMRGVASNTSPLAVKYNQAA